jgi:hypothetical protein
MSSTRQESKLARGDSDDISIASESSSDFSYNSDLAVNRFNRVRSLSFDDLYSLAPAQNGLSEKSKFAYTPLERETTGSGVPKSVSLEDLATLAEAYADSTDNPENIRNKEGDGNDPEEMDDNISVMSVPVHRTVPRPSVARRKAASEDDARDRAERTDEIVPDEADRGSSAGVTEDASEEDIGDSVASEQGRKDPSRTQRETEEDSSPAVQLFGKQVTISAA